jgi:hypothetical protein
MPSLRRVARITVVVGLVAAASCDDPTSLPPNPDPGPETWAPSLSVVSGGVPAVCGDPTEVGLMLAPNIRTGTVEVANDESNLYVTYRSDHGRSILATAVFVGDSPDQIPTTRRGLPRLFQFPYKSGHSFGTTEVVWEIPLSDVSGEEAVVAAFAQVGWLPSWGEGEPITPGRDWAMYFTHAIADCGPEPVGPEGGTASADDGRATLSVPAGALQEPVVIAIAPATVDDLVDHVPPEDLDPEAGTVFGVTPIPVAIFDLQPDGLQFTTPATIVLHYDESALPEGTLEENLGIFVINGIFEPRPSIVDADANTITAEIEHFSIAFVGSFPQPPTVDLEVTAIASPTDDPVVGEPVEVTAHIRNNGPDPSAGGSVVFDLTGPFDLDSVPEDCDQPAPWEDFENPVRCFLPEIGADETVITAPIVFIPLEVGAAITISATAFPGSEEHDRDPENDSHEVEVSFEAPAGATPDLEMTLSLAPGSERIVNGHLEVRATVVNRGLWASTGGTLRLSVFGQSELEPLFLCTALADPSPADHVVDCDVIPLAPDEFAVAVINLVPSAEGEIRIQAVVAPGPGDTEDNLENNVAGLTIPITSTFLVDLEPISPQLVGTRQPNSPLTFAVRVGNFRPPSNGGTIIYEATGDVALGEVAEACTPSPNPSAVAVFCDFDPFPGFVNDTGSVNQPIPVWVGPFEVIPQSDAVVTFSATTVPVSGDTDVNPDNDRIEVTLAIGQRVVDLEVLSLSAPDPATVGQAIDVVAAVRNLGPDDSRGALLVFSATGDVDLVEVDGPCLNVPTDEAEGVGVTTRCELAPFLAGSGRNVRFQIVPQSEGQVVVQAVVRASYLEDVDRNFANDYKTLPVQVVPGG